MWERFGIGKCPGEELRFSLDLTPLVIGEMFAHIVLYLMLVDLLDMRRASHDPKVRREDSGGKKR